MTFYGGIDLGGTKIEAIVASEEGEVRGHARRPTPVTGGPPAVAAEMAGALREAAGAADVPVESLAGVGVGSPGSVDPETGTVSGAGNLPDWAGSFGLGPALSDDLGVPVGIGNDVSVATRAEFELGAGREYSSLLGVFWGTGVGGGIVLDGKLWEGQGAAGEIGHIVVRRDGAQCPCGRRGCMEAYAGRGAMEQRARREAEDGEKTVLFEIMEKRGRPRLTSGIWQRALDAEDALAERLVERAIRALGTGVASAVNLLDVEAVVIGGGLGLRLGPRYRDRILAEMREHLFVREREPALLIAALGDLGGALGASLLVREERAPAPAPAPS
jgi:glucokinase